ncbi:MAG TPA: translocation/assembly module TamB domain-containing protein [Arenimonas sp.]|uniref:translocation/assembly module TamB domain-containing protein n=1 Tax=Arenimonas sp. TaxID=1872635 RepID=UPI002D7F2498|nr:translocation/assembly module TamB domain-containing protein [Arenimonas sp.]HEU0153428.1 translocation/assembly module TamB domain-containing protein [Arenimonas sp.]
MTAAPRPPRTFARRWGRRAGIGLGLLALAAGTLLFWLLATGGGRDELLGRLLRALPPDALQYSRAEGTVSGPLVLHDVVYRQDGLAFRARRVMLDARVLPVLGRRLQLDALEVDDAELILPPAEDAPFALPEWPGVLPRLAVPLDLRATRFTIDGFVLRQGDAAPWSLARAEGSDLHLVDGGLRLGALDATHANGRLSLSGEYLPDRNFRTQLKGRLDLPATDTLPAASLAFDGQGDLDRFALEAAGTLPERSALTLSLADGGGAAPAWTLSAESTGLLPSRLGLGDGEAMVFRLDARGAGGAAEVEGRFAQGELALDVLPSKLTLADGRLQADPLRLVHENGEVLVTGDLEADGVSPRFDLRLATERWRQVPAGTEAGAVPVELAGAVTARGRFEAWQIAGDLTLVRAGEQADITLAGRGDAQQLVLDTLRVRTPGGRLDGRGAVAWSPGVAVQLDAALAGFDPGYVLPDYPGAVSGQLVLDATQSEDGRWQGRASLDGLAGQLRGRALGGRARADWNGQRGTLDAALRVGDSQLEARGDFGDRYDLQMRFAPLQLADLVASGRGRVEGTLSVRGPAAAPDIDAALEGRDLAWNGGSADAVSLSGRLPARGAGGDLRLQATGFGLASLVADTLDLHARGSQAAFAIDANAAGPDGDLALAGDISRTGSEWRAQLETLWLAPKPGPKLSLQGGADLRYGPAGVRLARSCLVADAGGRLCASATGDRFELEGEALPLALAQPWLPQDDALPLFADGTLDLQASGQRGRDGRWRGEARVDSARGSLKLSPEARREVFGYTALSLQATLDDDRFEATLAAGLADEGSVSGRLRGGTDASAALDGVLQLDVRDLAWLELFSPDLAQPVGRLQGRLALAGNRAAPALSGQARLGGFAAELPGLGLKLADGEFTLVGDADGSARIDGSLRSGDGVLRFDGSLNVRDRAAPLQLVLQGERVTLASTAEFYVIGSPDLTLRLQDEQLEVRGRLDVPEARLDLEALDGSATVSDDVVVLDPVGAQRERALPLDLRFTVALGDDVRLKGFGLDGRMRGSLALRERPGRPATASGTLDVSGSYRAYGQSLQIQRARLGFANSPYDNPTLDIRAERDFDRVTVGVQVRGTARRPQTTVVSNPAMDTSEALSWLVFGRPLGTTTGNESQQLNAAAMALGAGGNLVAQQIGVQLGLDEAGVTDSRNLGGATFTVGKYVSPRLFLSYGVSLIGTGQVVTLKYLLTRGFDVSIESGNENAASLNWRLER